MVVVISDTSSTLVVSTKICIQVFGKVPKTFFYKILDQKWRNRMSTIAVLITAVALAMDAMSLSIYQGIASTEK